MSVRTASGIVCLATLVSGCTWLGGSRVDQGFTSDTLTPVNVSVQDVYYKGQSAFKVELTETQQLAILTGSRGGNGESLALLPVQFSKGVIELDIAGDVNGKGAADARGFVGIAFHVQPQATAYEAIYLRMANGSLALPAPEAPRNERGIQYIAHPDFHFQQSRSLFPGVYEKAAPVAPKQWFHYRIVVNDQGAQAYLNHQPSPVLSVSPLKMGASTGQIGLFVDDGSVGYFSNIKITHMP